METKPSVLEQAARLNLESGEVKEDSPLLPSRYLDSNLPPELSERLAAIDQIVSKEGKIPMDTLRLACQSVIKCIKDNEDLLPLLEPEDFAFISQSYIKVANQKTQDILIPKKKKATKATVKQLKTLVTSPEEEEF